jgi:hypothetical protein
MQKGVTGMEEEFEERPQSKLVPAGCLANCEVLSEEQKSPKITMKTKS